MYTIIGLKFLSRLLIYFSVNPDLKTAVYCTGVKLGGASVWDKVLLRYRETTSASERQFLLQALACVKEPWVIKKYVALLILHSRSLRNLSRTQHSYKTACAPSKDLCIHAL